MDRPHSHITCVSNVFIKQMRFMKAGDTEQGHAHCFDHVTLLSAGSLRLNALDKSTDFKAPHHIFIKAGVVHELVALEDDTLAHCIHAMRDGERVEDIVDPASIPTSYRMHEAGIDFYPLTEDELSQRTTQRGM